MRSTDRDMPESDFSKLTDEELVKLIQGGDDDALEYIFRKYKKLFESRAERYFLPGGGDRQDLVQEGMIGFYKAVRRFDPDKTVPFAAFADMCVSGQIKNAVTQYTAKKHEPLNSSVNLDGAGGSTENGTDGNVTMDVIDDTPGPEDYVILKESPGNIPWDDIPDLSSYEKSVLTLYLQGRNAREISAELKRPLKSVDNAMQRIRKKRRSQQCRKQ